ncbi:MAG TPA: ABC transporter substrate-binding protein, partial [Achromobacter sp.]
MPLSFSGFKHAILRVGAACLAAFTLAACDRASDTPAAPPPQTAQVDGFPITIGSALGQAVIAAPPKRVVTLGLGADDLALSLGVVPVG